MKNHVLIALIVLFSVVSPSFAQSKNDWKAFWISSPECKNEPNTWLAFRKNIDLPEKSEKPVIAKIAVDSKYWLWINGKTVVFEGGLKRGPNPHDTYYDEVNIAPYLKTGENKIAVLVWFFGKEGFSHKNSGKAGLIFDCQSPGINILSDNSWKCAFMEAFKTAPKPIANYRLPESSILFDARLYPDNWQTNDFFSQNANIVGESGAEPWNKLVLRPIPLFKDFGLKSYLSQTVIPGKNNMDTIVCTLPYNAQVTTYFKIKAPEENANIRVMTDNYLIYDAGDVGLRSEYITKKGIQEYENLGWVNGHKIYYVVPGNIKIMALKYRETGYDSELLGSFYCSDPFFNKLWEKSYRTLYITMRDNYMDCPDRERAQWTGDAVNEAGESLYTQSTTAHALIKKWLYEIIGWQRSDSTIYAPVPSGNWENELPGQSLASIGYYGLWTYYDYTGDKQTLADLYDGAKKYLDHFEIMENNTIKMPKPVRGWLWGDWGDNRDLFLIYNLWYYMAVKGSYLIANEIGKTDDAVKYKRFMTGFEKSFNELYWDGSAYRDPKYKGETDDRVQALAVVAGVVNPEKYPALLKVFKKERHASPYMEKYVFEAMMQMGYVKEALLRHKQRFEKMVDNPQFTTLFEGWGIGKEGFGGGTVNHAWSGGGLTILSRYLCGIYPLTPGYGKFAVLPSPGNMETAKIEVPTVKGQIKSKFFSSNSKFSLKVTVPGNTKAVLGVPKENASCVKLNGKKVWENGRFLSEINYKICPDFPLYIAFEVEKGKYHLIVEKH